MIANTTNLKKSPVFFIPNIIDYIRILLLISALCVFSIRPWIAVWLFLTNSVLDGLDGALARKLNQQSKLGALLDFSIDRASITMILGGCIWMYPRFFLYFIAVMMMDIASHFAVCYATAFNSGAHLDFVSRGSKLLFWFSKKNWLRYIICSSHDGFFGFLFGYFLLPSPLWFIPLALYTPGMLLKTWIHLEQFYLAAKFSASLSP